jgi:hypothetical protein
MENSAMDMGQDAMRGAPAEGSPQDNAADAGRGTDSVLAHLSLGEVVIPRAFLDDPQVMQALQMIFQDGGADMAEFTVGDPANKINPETGYPEFWKGWKTIRQVAKVAAPIAASFIPGVGPLAAAAIGAGAGAMGGGGLKGALIGGALSGIGSGLAGNATTALKGTALGGFENSISGALSPIGTAIKSGVSGIGSGIGSALSDFGNYTGLSDVGSGIGNAFSSLSGPVSGAIPAANVGKAFTVDNNLPWLTDVATGAAKANPFSGGASSTPSLFGSILGGSSSLGGGSSFGGLGLGSSLASALGGFQQNKSLNKQENQLLQAQGQQLGNLENLNPVDVQNDPGYQFNLQQGQQGLDRRAAANGGYFSGGALKDAAQYNQDFANNYYQQAYGRQADKVGAQNNIYNNTGTVKSNATMGKSNNINQTLANALGANVGNYNGSSDAQLLALLRQRGVTL